jgi:hypothetical protein
MSDEWRQPILSCASFQDAMTSVSRLLKTTESVLRRELAAFRVRHGIGLSPRDQLLQHLGLEQPEKVPVPGGVRWFHATRAPVGATFGDGILPTLSAMPALWESLGTVVVERGWSSRSQWEEYRRSFERADRPFARQFGGKRIVPGWEGPFAFLVRDAALGLHSGHKDFTAVPECLEDVCLDYQEVFGRDLLELYQRLTRRCLVVFVLPAGWPGVVEAALTYIHREVIGSSHGRDSNTNFSAEGRPVPRKWIEEIEWL